MPSQKEDIGLDFEFDNAAGWERRDGNNTRPPVRPSVSQQDRSQASDTGRNPTSTAPALQTRTASADAVRYPYGKPRSPRNRPSHYGKKRVSETSREGSVNYSHFRIPNLVRNPEEEEYENPQEPDSFQRDNEADRAEREGAPPHSSFQLPVRRHPEFDDKFFGTDNCNIRHIARKTNTHLSLPTSLDDFVIQMWGTDGQVRVARSDLLILLEQVQQSIDQGQRRVGGWIKINAAPTDRKQAHLDKMTRDAQIRRKYRHMPEDGTAFDAAGIFVWPTVELNPQNLLGKNLEALDEVRFEQTVHIIFNRKAGILRVLGNDPSEVEIAVGRIYGKFCELAARNRKQNRGYLVHSPSTLPSSDKVSIYKEHDLTDRQVTIKRLEGNQGIRVVLSKSKTGKSFVDWHRLTTSDRQKSNHAYLRAAIQQGLQDVIYFRGYAKLKIFIGKLVLFGYKRPKHGDYAMKEFVDMMKNPQTTGELIRHIGSARDGVTDQEVAEELITFCTNRVDLFQHYDADGGEHVESNISATFDLKLFDDKGHSINVRLFVAFERVPGVHATELANARGEYYKPGEHHWVDLAAESHYAKDNMSRRRGPVDVKVLDLEVDMAYQVELVTYKLTKDALVYPIFQEFVRRLRIESIPDESSGDPPPAGQPDPRPHVHRISFVNLPGIQVTSLIQKTKWRYWIKQTSYVFEITKYENIPVNVVSALYPDSVPTSFLGLKTGHDTRWGASVWNYDWDQNFTQQRHIGVGRKGEWSADVDNFFASSGATSFNGTKIFEDGFREMLGRVHDCLGLIRIAQEKIAAVKKGQGQEFQQNSFVGIEENDE